MSIRSLMLIAAAVLLIAGTVFVARGWLDNQRALIAASQPEVPEAATLTHVLVASADLPAGVFVNSTHLRWQPWPDDNMAETYLIQNRDNEDDLIGAVVRRGISAGQPITRHQVIKPGDRGFLAAVLRPGYRAMAISVDAASGIAGLVFPGDQVDIILTHTIVNPKDEKSTEHRASETVLTNVRVLALDQKIDDQDGQPKLAKTATLEVTPKQAEILTVSRELGDLALSLRSLAKDEEELRKIALSEDPLEVPEPKPGRTFTWDSEASILVPSQGLGDVVVVARGKDLEEVKLGGF